MYLDVRAGRNGSHGEHKFFPPFDAVIIQFYLPITFSTASTRVPCKGADRVTASLSQTLRLHVDPFAVLEPPNFQRQSRVMLTTTLTTR